MIRSVRCVTAKEIGARLSNTALVHTRLRLHAVDNARVVNEDALLTRAYARAGRIERPCLAILLDGEARITAHHRHLWMTPGDITAVDSKGEIQMRQAGERYASLALEWEPGFVGERGPPIASWRVNDLEPFRAVWRDVRAGRDPASTLASLLAHLVDVGVPMDRCRSAALHEEVPERMQELTTALDAMLSNLEEQPMMNDLEDRLGLSTRQLNRLVVDYNERYGFNSSGWIDTRNRRRLMIGATFMTVPGATAKYVARVVGYRSNATFSRALRTARLPAASEIAKEVARIEEATRAAS